MNAGNDDDDDVNDRENDNFLTCDKNLVPWAVSVAQLAERSLPIPEVRGSNSVIGEALLRTFIYCQLFVKDKFLPMTGIEPGTSGI